MWPAPNKEVVRAAFYTLAESHRPIYEHAQILHSFAISERAFDDNEPVKASKLRRKKKNRKKGPSAKRAAH